MPRPTSRVRLENGLKLNLNRLAQKGLIAAGNVTGPAGIVWNHSYWGEIASGTIWANLKPDETWNFLRIRVGELEQTIHLVRERRHFGGWQWYFVCPVTGIRASVLWKPPGATRFCSRQTWGRQVAYTSQCLATSDRLWRAKSKIKASLIGDLEPDEWELPPKPKWMRRRTYQRFADRFDRLEEQLDADLDAAMIRLLPRLEKLV
jgi:hypothetical protein